MILSLEGVLSLFVLGIAALYILSATRVRELALDAVRHASQRDDFQLLDQTIHIQRLSLSRDRRGRWRIWRQYRFEYSYDGVERLRGTVIMLGRELQAIAVSEPNVTLH